ncbi:calnexin independence factor cif1 [Gigaspora margarita]|uniref:Calnexin independence factor cif1 n=1 Tax=Gigaspora margarita TaxID=4874 RepID=A0A8H3XB06_GIGMA|nr:calnexin independence factor cif1 [Gigaspora margarita]
MQASTNKRKGETVILQNAQPTETKLSRQAHTCKNKKLRHDQKQTKMLCELGIDIPLITDDIIFDLSRHRIQFATQKISTKDSIYYLEKEWTGISLCSSDQVSSKKNQTWYDISARELLIETLIREAKSSNGNSLELLKIPLNFFFLIYTDIIRETGIGIESSSSNTANNRLWVAFGWWLFWKKLQHAHNIQSNRNFQDLFDIATVHNTKKEKACLIISACHNLQSISEVVQLKHITEPECIANLSNQTLVHLEQLNDDNAIIFTTNTVNNYYFHMLEHPSHRSDEFWTNFIEHFRAYTRNNLLPFTSSNTASTHNIDHHKCVNKLLQGLKPLSDCVNQFLQDYYENLYIKLSKLSWGPFAPKPFGVFPIIAINFNTTSDYHWDEHDEANSLCVLVALRDYEGGELCFFQLQMVVHLRPGQIVAFASRLLLHGNFLVTKGSDTKVKIKKGANRPMVSEQDLNNAQGLNDRKQLLKPKASQIQIPSAISDRR